MREAIADNTAALRLTAQIPALLFDRPLAVQPGPLGLLNKDRVGNRLPEALGHRKGVRPGIEHSHAIAGLHRPAHEREWNGLRWHAEKIADVVQRPPGSNLAGNDHIFGILARGKDVPARIQRHPAPAAISLAGQNGSQADGGVVYEVSPRFNDDLSAP